MEKLAADIDSLLDEDSDSDTFDNLGVENTHKTDGNTPQESDTIEANSKSRRGSSSESNNQESGFSMPEVSAIPSPGQRTTLET
jgi:hypothetical protein